MDEPGEHFHIVTQLKKFDQYIPKTFSDVVISELTNSDKETKYRAVKRFSDFWRLTANDKAYRPFLTAAERKHEKKDHNDDMELDDLEAIFGKKLEEEKKERS